VRAAIQQKARGAVRRYARYSITAPNQATAYANRAKYECRQRRGGGDRAQHGERWRWCREWRGNPEKRSEAEKTRAGGVACGAAVYRQRSSVIEGSEGARERRGSE